MYGIMYLPLNKLDGDAITSRPWQNDNGGRMQKYSTIPGTNIKDLNGRKFERLQVIGMSHKDKHGRAIWDCVCDCGAKRKVASSALILGLTLSCGCYSRDAVGIRNATHRMRGTDLYNIWSHILQRCLNPKHGCYRHYGGRGIAVCDEWKNSFEAFYRDMGDRPSPKHTIDRIDNDGGYSKDNCRWATPIEQHQNTRTNRYLTFNGETHCVSEWERRLGVRTNAIAQRIRKGWTTERALTEPVRIMRKNAKLVRAKMPFGAA